MRWSLLLVFAGLLVPRSVFAEAADPSLSAGGLAPPPAIESEEDREAAAAGPNQTEAELARADREDSGRGLQYFWLNGEVGVGHFGLGTFKANGLVDASVATTQTGLVAGAGLGARIVFFTVGARFRYAAFSEWKLWTLGAEGGVHMQLGSIEPYATLGAGYAGLSGVKPVPVGGGEATTSVGGGGVDVRLGLGFDYYFTNIFSMGVKATGDMLFLSRSKQAGAGAPGALPVAYAADGSSIGGGITGTAVAGLHF